MMAPSVDEQCAEGCDEGASRKDEMTDKEKRQVDAIREKMKSHLERFPDYDTDFALLRWLRGCEWDVGKVVPRLQWALETMSTVGLFDKDFSSIESVHNAVRHYTPLAEYFPGGPIGFDKHGNILSMNGVGSIRPRKLLECAPVSEFIIATLCECEGLQTLIRAEERKLGRKLGIVLVTDFCDFSLELISSVTAVRIYLNVLQLVQKLYLDSAVKLYVINTPRVIYTMFKMLESVLAKDTLERFEILGKDWKEVLARNHGEENLPECWGGSKRDIHIRQGGVIPEQLRLRALEKVIPAEKLTKITVPARSERRIEVSVEEGSTLSWYFTCSSGDIDFSVEHHHHEVWPQFRICTEFVPEYGSHVCTETGVYELVFSNKHGMIWSKQIAYLVQSEKKGTSQGLDRTLSL